MAQKHLEQLNTEAAHLHAKGDAVEKKWLAATDPQERAALWELYTDTRFERRQLDARRAAIEADLLGTGWSRDRVWDKEGNCNKLGRFLSALPAQQDAIKALVPGSTIELEGGAKWLGDPFASSAIYVREVYPELIAARDALVRERGWPQSGFETVFTGTPGVGKSYFGALFLAQKLLEGREILLESWHTTSCPPVVDYHWLSLESGVEHTSAKELATKRLKQSDASPIYMVDDSPPGIGKDLWAGESVVFCAQERGLWRGNRKGAKTLFLCVPVVSLGEMLSMKRALPQYQATADRVVEEWYFWAGGSATACLRLASQGWLVFEQWKQFHATSISPSTKMSDLLEMTLFEPWQTIQDRHQIFHWGDAEQPPSACVGSDVDMELRRFTHPCARFASERVRLQAMTSLQPNQMAEIALLCTRGGEPSAIQYWWETLYLQFLQAGVDGLPAALHSAGMDEAVELRLNLPAASIKYLASLEEATMRGKSGISFLLIPKASNGKIQGISKFALIEVTSAVINTDDGRHPQSQALQETLMVNESEAVELKLPTSAFALPARRFDIDYRKIGENSIKNGKLAPGALAQRVIVRNPLEDILNNCRKSLKQGALEFQEKVEKLLLLEGI